MTRLVILLLLSSLLYPHVGSKGAQVVGESPLMSTMDVPIAEQKMQFPDTILVPEKVGVRDQSGVVIENRFFDEPLIISNITGLLIRNNVFETTSTPLVILNSTDVTVESNAFSKFGDSDYEGIKIANSSNIHVTSNSMRSSSHSTIQYGISLLTVDSAVLAQNTIEGYSGKYVAGTVVDSSANVTIASSEYENILASSENEAQALAVFIYASKDVSVSGSTGANIHSTSQQGLSTSFGVSCTLCIRFSAEGNEFRNISSTSPAPESYGVHSIYSFRSVIIGNEVDDIRTRGEVPYRSFPTGILSSFDSGTYISENHISRIDVFGRAAYGVFVDQGYNISVVENNVWEIRGLAIQNTLVSGIIYRNTRLGNVVGNDVANLWAEPHFFTAQNAVVSGVGILVGSSEGVSISRNNVHNLDISKGRFTDAIGILATLSPGAKIVGNTLRSLDAGRHVGSIAHGISVYEGDFTEIRSNSVSVLNSGKEVSSIIVSASSSVVIDGAIISGLSNAPKGSAITLFLSRNITVNDVFVSNSFGGDTYIAFDLVKTNLTLLESLELLNSGETTVSIGIRYRESSFSIVRNSEASVFSVFLNQSRSTNIFCENVLLNGIVSSCDEVIAKMQAQESSFNPVALAIAVVVLIFAGTIPLSRLKVVRKK